MKRSADLLSASVNQPEQRKPFIKTPFSRSGVGPNAGGAAQVFPLSGNKQLGAEWAFVIVQH